MVEHAARSHATWSASSTERNWQCAGALALAVDLPEGQSSEAADWGTACHEIAEHCLFNRSKQASDYIGTTVKGKSHSFEVDEEMAETAQTYVDYVLGRIAAYKTETGKNALIFVEEQFSLESLKPPFDAGGIADCVLIFSEWKLLEVVDLKGGRGIVVEVKGNPQERTYALGALLKHQGHDITQVMATIVQPRAPHKDGRTRSETFHIADLVEWTADLVAAMKRAHQASVLGRAYSDGSIDPQWAADWLKAGDHCRFCKAKSFCPAIEKASLDVVGIWFDDLSEPRLPMTRDDDPVERAKKLDLLEMIESWITDYRASEHARAEAGDPAEGYILVPKQGREKWIEGSEEQVTGACLLARLPEAKYLNPGKLRTPKQIRKELGKQATMVDGLSVVPDAGTNLVRQSKTSRAAVPGTASRYFEPQT